MLLWNNGLDQLVLIMKNVWVVMDLYLNVLIILVITNNEAQILHHGEEVFEDP